MVDRAQTLVGPDTLFPGSAASEASDGPRLVAVFEQAPKAQSAVLVAVPAYNEERFIGSVVHGIRLEGFECLVVDDGSTDRTAEIALAAGAVVQSAQRNRGKAAAVTRAIAEARRRNVETLVLMDGDWQHDPREIHGLLQPIRAGSADIVSGSRFLNGTDRGIPQVRGIGLRAITMLANVATGSRITDSQTGFHAFSSRALDRLTLTTKGFAVEVEVQFLARTHRLRHAEVPIVARYDDPPKRNVMRQAAQVVDGLIRLVAHYRPLLFFGVPSAILLLVGALVGLLVVRIYQDVGDLAGGYALLAALMIIVGTIGLFAGLVLHVIRGIYLGLEQRMSLISRSIDGWRDSS